MVAVAGERERIARELHDIVAHSVSVMVVQSDGADAALQQQNLAEAQQAVTAIGRTGRDALTELRLLPGMLRGDYRTTGAAPLPGTDQLKELMRERVSLFGGSLITGPRPDGGFRVWALLPWVLSVSSWWTTRSWSGPGSDWSSAGSRT